jgi:hypothetical protein
MPSRVDAVDLQVSNRVSRSLYASLERGVGAQWVAPAGGDNSSFVNVSGAGKVFAGA